MLNLQSQSAYTPISAEMAEAPVSPVDLGMPEKFPDWRKGQWHAVEKILDCPQRFVVICAPTGFGKTILGPAAARISGKRTAILTATKGLQDQVTSEIGEIIADIRGLSNYLCPITKELGIAANTVVSDAPCQCGYSCRRRRGGGCEYYDRFRIAQAAEIFVTNYQCWLYDGNRQGEDLLHGIPEQVNGTTVDHSVQMLIADEAHSTAEELSRFLSVEFDRKECLSLHLEWPGEDISIEQWQAWAVHYGGQTARRVLELEARVKAHQGRQWSHELRELKSIQRKLDRMATIQIEDQWVRTELFPDRGGRNMTGVKFDPLNPARYAESALWRGVPKVVLISATVRPKTAHMLGIPSDDLSFTEYASSFPRERRPIIHVSCGVQMNYRNEQDDSLMRWWLNKLDTLIEDRLDRKGIIHAVSYTRAKFIIDNSRHKHHMLVHDSRNRAMVVEAFRNSDAPRILVSPSVDTGYDFHGEQARYQIIAKLPFASVTDPVVKARQSRDKDYGMYQTAQTIVQMTGRIVRSEVDWGETIILDDSILWAIGKMKQFMPRWWLEALVLKSPIPPPLHFD